MLARIVGALGVAAVAALAGCTERCLEEYLAGFDQVWADPAPYGGFRDAQPFGDGAMVVGDAGLIVRVDAAGLVPVEAGVDVDLHALIVTPTPLAVGDGGTIVRSGDGSMWNAVDSGTTADLYSASKARSSDTIVVVGNDAVLRSTDGGVNWTALTGEDPAGELRFVVAVESGFLAFAAGGAVVAVDAQAGTFVPTGQQLAAAVRNFEFDAVGDAWLVLVDGSVWTGYQQEGVWHFSAGGSSPCGQVGFRTIGGYTVCDNGMARELHTDRDEPSVPLAPSVSFRTAAPVGDQILLLGEDGVARLYAPRFDTRPMEYCPEWH